MLPPEDSIVAVATPYGRGAVGMVRLSGRAAGAIARSLIEGGRSLEPRRASFVRVRVGDDPLVLDDAIVVWFPAPQSYTGEDVVEFSLHGNPLLLEGLVSQAVREGARLARPGEFTLRSVMHGKRTLVEAEAVADLVDAASLPQARLAFDQLHGTLSGRIGRLDALLFDLIARLEASLDFPEEGYHFAEAGEAAATLRTVVDAIDGLLADAHRGRILREGATVAIVGRPNVGKSSLFNALVGTERVLVTELPGTTRDLVSERVAIDGVVVTLVDTAGVRETSDPIEHAGIALTIRAQATADLVLVVHDAAKGTTGGEDVVASEGEDRRRLVVWNKCDLLPADANLRPGGVRVSALGGQGLAVLRREIVARLVSDARERDVPAIANIRHIDVLRRARAAIAVAVSLVERAAPEEVVLKELHSARAAFDELVGARSSDDVLEHIFARFCIGK